MHQNRKKGRKKGNGAPLMRVTFSSSSFVPITAERGNYFVNPNVRLLVGEREGPGELPSLALLRKTIKNRFRSVALARDAEREPGRIKDKRINRREGRGEEATIASEIALVRASVLSE